MNPFSNVNWKQFNFFFQVNQLKIKNLIAVQQYTTLSNDITMLQLQLEENRRIFKELGMSDSEEEETDEENDDGVEENEKDNLIDVWKGKNSVVDISVMK